MVRSDQRPKEISKIKNPKLYGPIATGCAPEGGEVFVPTDFVNPGGVFFVVFFFVVVVEETERVEETRFKAVVGSMTISREDKMEGSHSKRLDTRRVEKRVER